MLIRILSEVVRFVLSWSGVEIDKSKICLFAGALPLKL